MILNALFVRGSILPFCRPISTGKAVMDVGKRAAARYAVDTYVKVCFSTKKKNDMNSSSSLQHF